MHAALEAPEPTRPDRERVSHPAFANTEQPSRLESALWLLALLAIVSLSVADGVLANVIGYERDTAVFYYPLMSWVSEQLRQGHFPLWTPQFFGGYPIFADGEIGLAYPPALLALLAMPADRALVWLRLVHLCIAAAGTFFLARAWRLTLASAALAGVVFSLGNFLQAQIHHENIVRTVSWLPVMLALTEQAWRSCTWRAQLRWTALAACALGLAGLSLHSQMLAMDLMVLAAYSTFRWWVGPLSHVGISGRAWLRRLGAVACVSVPVVVGGLAIAAVQLVPLVELAGFSARGSGIPYSESAAYSVTPYGLLQLVFPYVFRAPGNVQWGLWTHWESYLYIGLAPLVLAIVALACVRCAEVWGWAVIGGLGLILSLGQYSPLNLHYLLWLLPGLSGLRAPGRFSMVVVLAGAMLAAYGLAWLQTTPEPRRRLVPAVRGIALGGLCLTLLLAAVRAVVFAWPSATEAAIQAAYLSLARDSYPLPVASVMAGLRWSTDPANPHLIGPYLLLLATLLTLWLWQRSSLLPKRLLPALLLALTAADLLAFDWGIHPREPFARITAEAPAVQAVAQIPPLDGAPNRVLAAPVLAQVAADRLAPVGTLQEANGYSSLQFIWHRDYLGRVLYADDALLDLWNVRFILDPAHYGTLSNYKGVSFLPQQALLHAPSGGALADQRFAVAPSSPIKELRVVSALQGAVDVPQGAAVGEVELRDELDRVVGTAELQAGRDVMDWSADVPAARAYVKHQRVESAGVALEGGSTPPERQLSFAAFAFDPPVSAASIEVRATPPAGELVLYGAALVGTDDSMQQLFGRTKTKYRQVYADGEIRVLEDTAALPRAFLVPTAHVVPSLGTALSQMVHQPFWPDQEVVLADDATTQATTGVADRGGGSGTATVTAYNSDSVTIHSSASADAWLVLSDTYYPGWVATVDDQPAPVLRGDVLFRVVPVPGGEHEVQLRFAPVSIKVGLAVSLLAALFVAAALILPGNSARRRRTT